MEILVFKFRIRKAETSLIGMEVFVSGFLSRFSIFVSQEGEALHTSAFYNPNLISLFYVIHTRKGLDPYIVMKNDLLLP